MNTNFKSIEERKWKKKKMMNARNFMIETKMEIMINVKKNRRREGLNPL